MFGRTIWICRIPAASVILGLLLLSSAPQAQDLFAELRGAIVRGVPYWASFYLLVFAVWMLPVYVCAKLSLLAFRNLPGNTEVLGRWSPRIVPATLALLCGIAVLIGQVAALQNLHLITEDRPTILSMFVAYFASLPIIVHEIFSGDIFKRTLDVDALSLRHTVTMPIVTMVFIALAWLALSLIGRRKNSVVAFVVYGAALTLCYALFLFIDPLVTTRYVSGALLVPFVFGAWVPLLAAISYAAHRLRVPLVLILILSVAGLSVLLDARHTVRTVGTANQNSQIEINQAIASWRRANGCADGQGTVDGCPSPIIVSAAGGASRAAFFTATVLGELMDETQDNPEYRDFATQLFAISAVSGGSLGAATFVAALEQRKTEAGAARSLPPCRPYSEIKDDQVAAPTLWHVALDRDPGQRYESYNGRWRDCLQMIAAGDFISPVFVGLAFTDMFGLSVGGDRAVILEDAWEQRYKALTGSDGLAGTVSASAPDTNAWRPILLLNAASAETGRRLIISNLFPIHCKGGVGRRIFKDAYDLHEVLRSPSDDAAQAAAAQTCACGEAGSTCAGKNREDVRLSTAAVLSARFPIISPYGIIRNADGRPVDRIVDGGYFENYGADTALELADTLLKEGLKPVILQVTNSPDFGDLDCLSGGRGERALGVANVGAPRLFEGFRAILRGLLETQTARGNHATIRLCNWTAEQEQGGVESSGKNSSPERFAEVRVFPAPKRFFGLSGESPDLPTGRQDVEVEVTRRGEYKELSMSWWLSKAVQRYLDSQLPVARQSTADAAREERFVRVAQDYNAHEIEKVLRALKRNK